MTTAVPFFGAQSDTSPDLALFPCGKLLARLVLVACPDCSHIAVICAEEGSGFQNLRTIEPELAVDPESVHCQQCGRSLLSAFTDATSDQILSAGLSPTDYE